MMYPTLFPTVSLREGTLVPTWDHLCRRSTREDLRTMTPDRRQGEEPTARLILPQLQLDDLLSELQTRLEAARATRDRVHALLEAVVSIGADLELETVLRRIVEAATTLADARYGALGVI